MVLGTLLNLVSPSGVERMLWTPVAAALAVLLWLSRGPLPDTLQGSAQAQESARFSS
jgi:hypothetical protein